MKLPFFQSRLSFARTAIGVLLWVVAPVGSLCAQTVVVAESQNGVQFDVKTYNSSGTPAPTSLAGVVFHPLELTGRTDLKAVDFTIPRRISDPGIPDHILLANGSRIYAFSTAATRGFFLTDTLGNVRILDEIPSPNPPGIWSPFVAVPRDGSHLAWSAAGAVARIIHIPSGAQFSVAPPSPPASVVDETSLTFASGALFYTLSESSLVRADLSTWTAAVLALPPSGGVSPAYVDPELVISADGSTLAFFAGKEKKLNDLYIAKATGAVWNRTKSPARHEMPGFLPDEPLGPNLALSADGLKVAYLRKVDESELFLADTDANSSTLGTLLTGDANFQESIGTGVTVGFRGSLLTFGFGGVTGTFDIFTVATASPVLVQNLTLTGSLAAPFQDVATVVPQKIMEIPQSSSLLVVDGGAFPGIRFANPGSPTGAVSSAPPALLGTSHRGGFVSWLVSNPGGSILHVARSTSTGMVTSSPAAFAAGQQIQQIAGAPTHSVAAVRFNAPQGSGVTFVPLTVGQSKTLTFRGAMTRHALLDTHGFAKIVVATPGRERVAVSTHGGQLLFSTPAIPAAMVLQ